MKFFDIINQWANRYFSQPDAIYLVVMLLVATLLLMTLGGALAPVLTGLVVAFLLQGIVSRLQQWRVPRLVAVYSAFLLFVGSVLMLFLLVVPLLWRQLQKFATSAPKPCSASAREVSDLAQRFPEYVTQEQISTLLEQISRELANAGGVVLETAFSQVFSLVGLLLYLVLVPISVFFLLKTKTNYLMQREQCCPLAT